MSAAQQIVLIPGFFGFVNLGQIVYFAHVREFLLEALRELGVEADVHAVTTEPTASVRRRAVRVLESIDAVAEEAPIHLIGHSTGGLDARLVLTPGVSLDTELPTERLTDRVRSVVTVATPHHGTPAVKAFIEQASQDQALMGQLTPEGIDMFNASTTDRPGGALRCGGDRGGAAGPALGLAARARPLRPGDPRALHRALQGHGAHRPAGSAADPAGRPRDRWGDVLRRGPGGPDPPARPLPHPTGWRAVFKLK